MYVLRTGTGLLAHVHDTLLSAYVRKVWLRLAKRNIAVHLYDGIMAPLATVFITARSFTPICPAAFFTFLDVLLTGTPSAGESQRIDTDIFAPAIGVPIFVVW